MHTRLFAVMATVGLVLFALGPGAATAAAQTAGNDGLDVSVRQAGNAGPVVTVTDNDTAVENASVTVEALDNGTYEGVGENSTTDANGTVSLPAPEENVTVEVTATAGESTGSTTAELTASSEADDETDSFGERVSAFVQSLLSGDSDNIGRQIAEFITTNNPGNAPDHAGPPSGEEDRRGPPEHAGPNGDDDDAEDDETERGNGNAPANAGPPEDRGGDDTEQQVDAESDEEEREDEATEEEDSDADDDDDDSGGPPEHARGNGGDR